MDSISITITKEYFDTLIRRAELHNVNDGDVTIPRTEYDALHQSHRDYLALRAALLAGGATEETLELLTKTPLPLEEPQNEYNTARPGNIAIETKWSAEAAPFVPAQKYIPNYRLRSLSGGQWRADPTPTSLSPESYGFEEGSEKSSITSGEKEDVMAEEGGHPEYGYQDSHDHRSLVIRGISNRTTLADVTQAVRGGQVLNVYLRLHEREAHVSFVDPHAAEKFLIYSKRQDLYVRGKRVEVFWADRQRFMPGHIAHKIERFGATRNLIIRFPKADVTPESVSKDLEHVHLLEVVDITTIPGGHLIVSLNDINLAVISRTCMSSRLTYKGSRVEFHPDECMEPLPPIVKKTLPRVHSESPKKKLAQMASLNRFQALSLLGDQENEDRVDQLHRPKPAGRAPLVNIV